MATPASKKWEIALQIEAKILSLLREEYGHPTYADVDRLVQELRITCEAILFLDFSYGVKVGVSQHLWDIHTSINNRYRKMLDRFRKGNSDQKKLIVERRKIEKHYVDFIKTSQFFYKGSIQRFASHFAGMQGLRRVAHRLSLSEFTVEERATISPELEHMIEMSCHATLLRLGDLSRYRNMIRTKDRSWEPALGYYHLANDLYPDSGSAHNQMAVIALAEENHLNALYHLYRAMTAKEPHPLAKNNLEIQVKKVVSAWEKRRPQAKTDSLTTLTSWFVLLHSKFYAGVDFPGHQELENEVLSRLTLLLKEKQFGETLEKFVLISVASEYVAASRVKDGGDTPSQNAIKSFYFCLEFNVRIMFVLCQVLLPELDDNSDGEELPTGAEKSRPDRNRDKITATTRRVLPALRQYGTWLATSAELLVGSIGTGAMNVHFREMWDMYAIMLTRLANYFPVDELVEVKYLLEEDEGSVGFKPFRDDNLSIECNLYVGTDGELKPRITDPGIERHHPNIEMQARVRDILLCGLGLQLRDEVPITLDTSSGIAVFKYQEIAPVSSVCSPPAVHMSSPPMLSPVNTNSRIRVKEPTNRSFSSHATESVTTSNESRANSKQSTMTSNKNALVSNPSSFVSTYDATMKELVESHDLPYVAPWDLDSDMNRMVDSLLEPPAEKQSPIDETSYGMHSRTANEIFAPISTTGFETRIQSTPKLLPSLPDLPDLYGSAFKPQPHELNPSSPHRPSTSHQLSPLSLSTNDERLAAAMALDDITGSRNGSWGRQSSRSTSGQQPVNQILQESLAQQFMPISSNAFSDSSSIYANTPRVNHVTGARPLSGTHGNNSTVYPGASDFDRITMLQSSIWNGSQPATNGYSQTPPGGQGWNR